MKLTDVFFVLTASFAAFTANANTFVINDKTYDYDVIEQKEIGPGIVYNRIRIPEYPLNINYTTVDMNNPYNRIETFQANDKLGGTETLASVYERKKSSGMKPLAGQNANFWVVPTQGIYSDFNMGGTYNGNLSNGKIISETNSRADQWNGGPTRTGIVGIDKDKKVWLESMAWEGVVSSSKWGAETNEFAKTNNFCRSTGEMVLYNSYYGKDKAFKTIGEVNGKYELQNGITTEVYCVLDRGAKWGVNQEISAIVKQVTKNTQAGTLGEYDFCLAGTGVYKTNLEKLAVGDKITIKYAWKSCETGATPYFENLIGGNAIVLKNGELTGRNNDEAYNSQIYSRSAYGLSQDGKKLFMFVIDKSTDPVYGFSAGCNTADMAQIMKQLGAWDVCNVDAGGSAQLMVQGNVVNKTTESTPRSIANGLMVFSTAPESGKLARLEFLDAELNIPIFSSYKPVILGYNEYGDLIDENITDFELTCDANIGTIANKQEFRASGKVGTGKLVVKVGNLKVEKTVNVIAADLAIKTSKILIDSREYNIPVISKSGTEEFECDPASLTWTVKNPEVAKIENGVLSGLQNGTTEIEGAIGDKVAKATVVVELATANAMPVLKPFPTEGWNLKQIGGKDLNITEYQDGFKLKYISNGVGRGAYITASRPMKVWSLPDFIRITINPHELAVRKISMNAQDALGNRVSSWIAINEMIAKNSESTFDVSLSTWTDPDDICIYPITINSVRFDIGFTTKGVSYELDVPEFQAIYNYFAGVNSVEADKTCRIYPNPVMAGADVNVEVEGQAMVKLYSLNGALVATAEGEGRIELPTTEILPGMYVVRVETADAVKTAKLIVK